MSGLFAGAARASIAPRSEELAAGVWLGGFGSYRQRRATAVHDEPQCRALALSDGITAFVVAALDLVGASGPLLQEIRQDAARLTGVAPEQIIVACTHSHASPDSQGLWGGLTPAYRDHIAHRAGAAIWEAHQALAPAVASAVTTTLGDGLVLNRRGWPETDRTLTALRFTREDGAPVSTLINAACHPTTTGAANTEVSRDWCGYAVDAIERETGGVAVYVNGAIGDANPAESGGFDPAQRLGEAVAGAALAALRDAVPIGGFLRVRAELLELPVNAERLSERVQSAVARAGPALSVLAKSGGMGAASLALHAAGRGDLAQIVAALAGISERGLVRRDGRTCLPTLCGYLRIGDDVEALVAPGEVLTRLALPLRAALAASHRLFLGLSHDTLGYFVPEDEWMTGRNNNYEESVSMGKHAGAALADGLLRLVPHGAEKAGGHA
ncbi:MAG TPA: hypothetical protein VFC53_01655 [Dehalococcoidia bacterium]|nr:hypothetical protein [Dehalococcoidia bacterium]